MKNTLRRSPILSGLVLLAFSALAFAGVQRIAYQTTRGPVATGIVKLYDGVAGDATVISASWTSPVNPYYTRGNPNINVGIETSDDGDTIEMTVGLYHYDESASTYTFLGLADVVSTTMSTNNESAAGTFVNEDLIQFPTGAATAFDLRFSNAQPLGGTITVRMWGEGVQPTLTAAPAP